MDISQEEKSKGYREALRKISRAEKSGARSLFLSHLGLKSVPPEIAGLTSLTALDLSNNELSTLPATIGKLTSLTYLDVTGNRLFTIPGEIGALKALKQLHLSSNRLSILPIEIGRLTKLTELDVSRNRLDSLPTEIGNLTSLTQIRLHENGLRALPRSIGQLSNLPSLNLSNNKLTSIPSEIGTLTTLRHIDLQCNQLASLPVEIGALSGLTELHLSENKLSSLPVEVGKLRALTQLTVCKNRLSSLPDQIGRLTLLQRLDVSDNQLTSLPAEIVHLTDLKELILSDNQLSSLPLGIKKLRKLEELFLHGNERLRLPAEVLGPTLFEYFDNRSKTPAWPADILAYYFRAQEDRRPLNEAKLIIVGRGGVGKTSLVNRLLHNRFDRQEGTTEGICISEWALPLGNGEGARLNIWDFGGQEIMHATHQFFLTQRSLYVLVLEGRQGSEDSDAEYWLKLIESFGTETDGDTSPVIVVLNKIEHNSFDLNRRALQQKYPFIRAFVQTDCADPSPLGIEDLRSAIILETDRLKHLRVDFPASWFAIKEQMAAMRARTGKSFLSFEDFRRCCAEAGETDTEEQESLATHLHNLGIALNFRDDPRLKDTHILNPHWVTNGIYKILNSKQLAAGKGEIRLKDASGILDVPEYPLNMHRFLFDLMKKFQLCFTFPDDDGHYLIPELLDKQQPAEADAFQPEECLNFEFRYPILPEGLLPRFIVRTHSLSVGLARWRTGAILAFEGNQALVKADVQDKRVTIAVNGPAAGRRRLLAVIRSDFERIHQEINRLRPEAFVPLPERPNAAVPYEKLIAFEREEVFSFQDVFGGEVLTLVVRSLLDGIDLKRLLPPEEQLPKRVRGIRLFYSYSHEDENLRDELETHLKLLERQGIIISWHDRRIDAGVEWREEIDRELERAEIILLLISASFIKSKYCYEIEMTRALERHKSRKSEVIPVILRDVNWTNSPFGGLQALPLDGKPVTLWENRDSAWKNVSEGIEGIAKDMLISRMQGRPWMRQRRTQMILQANTRNRRARNPS